MNTELKEFENATKRGQETLAASPLAAAVSYQKSKHILVIELKNGASVLIPVKLMQILQEASPEEIADVETAVDGLYLRWKSLGEDMSVPNLINGIFGTAKWMRSLNEHLAQAGRKGGAARTAAKRKSSAANGKLGGRPRKSGTAK